MTSTDDFQRDDKFEKKLLRKVDLRIIPLLTLLYLFSFLDRVNIGNAKLAHIEKDLGLVGDQFNWCLSIYFIGYILFDVPSCLVLVKARPSIWIPSMMVAWGLVVTLTPLVKNYSGMLAIRFFLGIAEAGLFPAIVYLVTMWYKRSEQSLRFGIFSVGVSIGGSFSGLLAYSIMKLDGKQNLKGWQWLFLIEGLITIVVAGCSYFLISDYPEDAKWLNEKERKFAIERLKDDLGKAHTSHSRFDKKQIFEALKDWKIYTAMLQIIGFTVPIYSFSFYLPSIISGLGFNFVVSQLLSAPPYLCAAIGTLTIAIISDRKRTRGPFIIASATIAMIGYILLSIPTSSIAAKYVGACIVATGLFSCYPTTIAWLTNNLPGNLKRSVAIAMIVAIGNLGAFFAPHIYRPKDAPHYLFGHLVAMGFVLLTICSSTIQYFCLKSINKKKEENLQSLLEGMDEKEIAELGEKHPEFRYSL